MKRFIPACAITMAALSGVGCASTKTVTVTVTKTAPAAVSSVTASTPSPTATGTAPSDATSKAPRKTVTKKFSGTGSYTSRPVHFGCVQDGNPLTVHYQYSGNASDGSADNFEAEVDDSTGEQVGDIANDIAVSGDKTTNLYPGNENIPPFHFSVTADTTSKWSLTFTCDAS